MYAAKHDLIVKPEDSHWARDLIGPNIVEYLEIDGGHVTFMVGYDQSYFAQNAMNQIKKYNPILTGHSRPVQVRASHILLKHEGSRNPVDRYRNKQITRSKEEAIAGIEKIRERIVAGEDFNKLAQSFSECGSAQKGGDLGQFGPGQMQKAFEDAAFDLKVGEISGIVDSDSGIHVILRTE